MPWWADSRRVQGWKGCVDGKGAHMIRTTTLRTVLATTVMFVPAQVAAQTTTPASTRAPKQYTIEQFLDTVSNRGASFSADESRILFSSNKTGIWNA